MVASLKSLNENQANDEEHLPVLLGPGHRGTRRSAAGLLEPWLLIVLRYQSKALCKWGLNGLKKLS